MYRAFACGLYVTCVFFCDKKEEEEEFLILGVRIRQYVGIAHWALANACLMLQRIQSTGKQLYQQKVLLTFITFTYSYTIIIIIIMFLNDNRLRQVHCHWLYHRHQLIKNVQPDICKQLWCCNHHHYHHYLQQCHHHWRHHHHHESLQAVDR